MPSHESQSLLPILGRLKHAPESGNNAGNNDAADVDFDELQDENRIPMQIFGGKDVAELQVEADALLLGADQILLDEVSPSVGTVGPQPAQEVEHGDDGE